MGQKKLLSTLRTVELPHFIILAGNKGSGRHLIVKEIADILGATLYDCGTKIDNVREVIENSKSVTEKMVYLFADADNMSTQAANALLKITEEPTKNTYLIITLIDANSVLPTIRSRATVFNMDNYTSDELIEYALYLGSMTPDELDIIVNICQTPGDIRKVNNMGIIEFWEFVNKVVDNITLVSIANSFKIGEKIAFKDNEDKYDLNLFWRAFMMICTESMTFDLDKRIRYAKWIKITSQYLQNLRITALNKQALFDGWILEIRGNK